MHNKYKYALIQVIKGCLSHVKNKTKRQKNHQNMGYVEAAVISAVPVSNNVSNSSDKSNKNPKTQQKSLMEIMKTKIKTIIKSCK